MRPRLLSGAFALLLLVAASCEWEDTPPPQAQRSTEPSSPSESPDPSKEPDGDGNGGGNEDKTVAVPGGATLTSLPHKAENLCIQGPPLSRACPLLVPHVRGTTYLVEDFGRPGGRFQVLEMTAGAPSNKDPRRNAPPRVAHLVVEVGKPGFLIDLGEPAPTDESLDGLLQSDHDGALLVKAKKEWDWNAELILAPSFPSGGAHGSHLIYSWKGGGYEYRISLHTWSPADEVVNTLRAIVRSAKSP